MREECRLTLTLDVFKYSIGLTLTLDVFKLIIYLFTLTIFMININIRCI